MVELGAALGYGSCALARRERGRRRSTVVAAAAGDGDAVRTADGRRRRRPAARALRERRTVLETDVRGDAWARARSSPCRSTSAASCGARSASGRARARRSATTTPSSSRRVADHLGTALRTAELYEQLEQTHLGTAEALAAALEAKDTYTADHARSIADLAVAVGRALGLDDDGPARPALRRDLPRHRQDRHPRRDPQQAGAADGGRARGRAPPPRGRRADPRPRARSSPASGGSCATTTSAGTATATPTASAATRSPSARASCWSSTPTTRCARTARTGGRCRPRRRAAELRRHAGTQFDPRVVDAAARRAGGGGLSGGAAAGAARASAPRPGGRRGQSSRSAAPRRISQLGRGEARSQRSQVRGLASAVVMPPEPQAN